MERTGRTGDSGGLRQVDTGGQHRTQATSSDINLAIDRVFKRNDIEIPLPGVTWFCGTTAWTQRHALSAGRQAQPTPLPIWVALRRVGSMPSCS